MKNSTFRHPSCTEIAIKVVAINTVNTRVKRYSRGKISEPAKQWNAMRALSNSSLLRNDSMPDSILPPVRGQWFDLRFTEDARKIQCECRVCMRPMWFPPSKAGKYVTCGAECSSRRYAAMGNPSRHEIKKVKAPRTWNCKCCGLAQVGGKLSKVFCSEICLKSYRDKKSEDLRLERTKSCKKCEKLFVVKKSQIDSGGGNYCSSTCWFDSEGFDQINAPEVQGKAVANRRASIAKNGTKHKHGVLSASWMGGKEASTARGRPKARESLNKYRKNNPEKVREFTQRRKGRILGSLPKGLLKKIGDSQKWMCVVCRASIKSFYHMDHVMPLAKGGKHEATNIQLLCPSCNVRKSAKHPIDFMQERGFLL